MCLPARALIRDGCIEMRSRRLSKSTRAYRCPRIRKSTPRALPVHDPACQTFGCAWRGVCPRKSLPLYVRRQQLCEAKLVPVRVGDVKEALAPGSISRRLKLQSLCQQCPVVPVHVINSENGAAPPSVLVSRTRHQVEEGFAGFQTADSRTFAAVQQLESKLLVEFDRTSHVTDGEGHCADMDHLCWAPVASAIGIMGQSRF